jgi:hypothetical protein
MISNSMISLFWLRFLTAVAVGVSLGLGAGFLALGLLPEFPPRGPAAEPERIVQSESSWAAHAPMIDPPELRAEKRRLATAVGIGCIVSAVSFVTTLLLSRKWMRAVLDKERDARTGRDCQSVKQRG